MLCLVYSRAGFLKFLVLLLGHGLWFDSFCFRKDVAVADAGHGEGVPSPCNDCGDVAKLASLPSTRWLLQPMCSMLIGPSKNSALTKYTSLMMLLTFLGLCYEKVAHKLGPSCSGLTCGPSILPAV
jgi:hypothetical protein